MKANLWDHWRLKKDGERGKLDELQTGTRKQVIWRNQVQATFAEHVFHAPQSSQARAKLVCFH